MSFMCSFERPYKKIFVVFQAQKQTTNPVYVTGDAARPVDDAIRPGDLDFDRCYVERHRIALERSYHSANSLCNPVVFFYEERSSKAWKRRKRPVERRTEKSYTAVQAGSAEIANGENRNEVFRWLLMALVVRQ